MNEVVREWRGTRESVGASLGLARARGQLVSVQPLHATVRGVAVRVVLRERPLEAAPRRVRRGLKRRGWEYRAACGVVLATAFGIFVWLLVKAACWAWARFTAWLAAHAAEVIGAAVMVLIGAGLVLYGLGKIGVCCPGLHCPGCRHSS